MLGVARSFIGSRFVRSIASTSYRLAAVQESTFEDICKKPNVNEEDTVVMQRLNEVLINAKKDNQPPGEALKAYDGPFTLEGVSRAVWETKDVESAKAVIDWASRQPGFYYTSRLMKGIFQGLNAGDQLDEAKKLVCEELLEKFKPTPAVHRALAKHYVAAKKFDAFKKLLEEMQTQGIEPDENVSSLMLKAKWKESGVEEMLGMFKDKIEAGWVPNGYLVANVLTRLCDSKKWTEALEVYNLMRSKGIVAIEKCMCVLMKELCRGKNLDEAYTVTKHLLESPGFESFWPPFRTVVNHLCDAGKLDEAYEVYKAVHDRISLDGMHLVLAYSREKNFDRAMEVLDTFKPHGKDATAFKIVIGQLCKGDRLEDARKVKDRVVEAGISPDDEISNWLEASVKKFSTEKLPEKSGEKVEVDGSSKKVPKDKPKKKKLPEESGEKVKVDKPKKKKSASEEKDKEGVSS